MKHSTEYICRQLMLPALILDAVVSLGITLSIGLPAFRWDWLAWPAVVSAGVTAWYFFRVWREVRWLRAQDRLTLEPRRRLKR